MGTDRRGSQGLGDLNGEKSNNCIRPEGGRAFREGCSLLLLLLLSFFRSFISFPNSRMREELKKRRGRSGDTWGLQTELAVKVCPCN